MGPKAEGPPYLRVGKIPSIIRLKIYALLKDFITQIIDLTVYTHSGPGVCASLCTMDYPALGINANP